MPQLIVFPFLGSGDGEVAVDGLISVCRGVPADGEPVKEFRTRARAVKLWDRNRVADTLAWFGMAKGDVIVPSSSMRAVAEAGDPEAARDRLADRLWQSNPVLFKTVIDLLAERVYMPGELYSFFDSTAYRGTTVPRAQLQGWVHLAGGLQLVKQVGIAIALDRRSEQFLDRAKALDIVEFLEEDEPEAIPEPIVVAGGGGDPAEAPAVPVAATPASAVARAAQVTGSYSSPHEGGSPVPVAAFSNEALFSDEILSATSQRLGAWWHQQSDDGASPIEDFGLDGESWMDNSDEALYRLAVAASLVFRLGRDRAAVGAAFRELDSARVLEDLYYGNAPDNLSDRIDSKALMLASLVARRCAEVPDLAATLEKQSSAAAAFEALDNALGRGLFKLELFWMMRGLRDIGALRFDDLADYSALPHRVVRDTLFRLGFIDSPYAADAAGLVAAASAAHRAAGDAAAPDRLLAGFAGAAGCSYDCANKRSCVYACRERTE